MKGHLLFKGYPCRWTGTFVKWVELIYGLQKLRYINDGETAVYELASFFGFLAFICSISRFFIRIFVLDSAGGRTYRIDFEYD